MKKAIITGITGQDGSYLSELLLSEGYQVHGIVRRTSQRSTRNIQHILTHPRLVLHSGDLLDSSSLQRIVREVYPSEVYNLAAQSHVRVSFDVPQATIEANTIGYVNLLEAVRKEQPEARVYQASTSEMFGSTPPPQNEETKFHPRSPYGCAKLASYWLGVNYRESYGMHVSNGILFNHESPRRGEEFVTRKITLAAARIAEGLQKEPLFLGNLDAKRDWGHAKDFVEAMWLMTQKDKPDDYVVATGEAHTVQEFVEAAFGHFGLDWQEHVRVDPKFCRPAEVDYLCGDPSKAHVELGWKRRYTFDELVRDMCRADRAHAEHESLIESL